MDMEQAERIYSYNTDGSIRAEIVSKTGTEGTIMPMGYFARVFGIDVADAIVVDKRDFRGLILNAKYVNNDGIACDESGNPLQDENFKPLPGYLIPEWDQYLWINRDGSSIISDEDYKQLSATAQSNYHVMKCVEVKLTNQFCLEGKLYLCEDNMSVLAELLRRDVWTGDPIIRRYRYECRHNEGFAARYEFALNLGLKELAQDCECVRLGGGIIRHIGSGEVILCNGYHKPGKAHRADNNDDTPEYRDHPTE